MLRKYILIGLMIPAEFLYEWLEDVGIVWRMLVLCTVIEVVAKPL